MQVHDDGNGGQRQPPSPSTPAPLGSARESAIMGERIPISEVPPMVAADTSIHGSPAQSAFPGTQPDVSAHGGVHMSHVGYPDPHFSAPYVQQGGPFFHGIRRVVYPQNLVYDSQQPNSKRNWTSPSQEFTEHRSNTSPSRSAASLCPRQRPIITGGVGADTSISARPTGQNNTS